MQLLTNEQQQSYKKAKICYIFKEKFENKYLKDKKCLSVFHNGSNYDYHFIIKELAEEFKKQFTCLRENTEKHPTCTVPIGKEVTRNDKNGEEITKNKS